MGARPGSQRKLTLREKFRMEIDLEVPESIDFSEFPANKSVENKSNSVDTFIKFILAGKAASHQFTTLHIKT